METNELLPEICLLPPPLGIRWKGAATTRITETPDGQRAAPWPLFWYDPPWHHVAPAVAQQIAAAVDRLRIPVAALGRDFGLDDLSTAGLQFGCVPYRPDRYGLTAEDLDAADTIDIRLARVRDEWGRFAYSSAQVQRWLDREDVAVSIPAPGWPAELTEVAELAGKLHQLRQLNPAATCAISIPPYRLPAELPGVAAVRPDVVILRMDDSDEIVGNHLARIVAQARALLEQASLSGPSTVALWLVLPNAPTPDDCAKLFALGANAIAIDWWCQPLIPAAHGGTLSAEALREQASRLIKPRMNRLAGLTSSYGLVQPGELDRSCLGTTDHRLAEQIGLTAI